jgi:hypothetical protein
MEARNVPLGEQPAAEEAQYHRPLHSRARAIVHLGGAPAELLEELPDLYSSAYSTIEYFTAYDRPWRTYACELDEPRHVIAFTARGATVDVLNKVIDIEPDAAKRCADAIFEARPATRRIRAEVKFAPPELGLPVRELYRADDQVIELPSSSDEWERSLSRSSRRNLRQYRNRLHRQHPDFALRSLERTEIALPLVEQVFAWNRQRIHDKAEHWIYEGQPDVSHRVWRLLQRRGVALCGYIGDECVAAELLLFVGHDCWAHTAAFDPAYLDVRLGSLMTSFAIEESIRRGCARTHLGWGTTSYKHNLGAAPVTAYRVSIFASRFDKALYVRERWSTLLRDRRIFYWRARKALKRLLPAASTLRAPGARHA